MSITIQRIPGSDPPGTTETHALHGLRPGAQRIETIEADALAVELKKKIQGEVRFDDGSRALYATDGSNYRQIPIGVVVPKSIEDVVETVAAARRFHAPILNRGGGTSLAGQCCNVAVVLDYSKYLHHVLHVDADRRLGRVQPGCVLDTLRDAAMKSGLTFGPDPATHTHCTLGGMVGNDSCGIHSVMAQFRGGGPRTAENIEELEVLLYDGTRMRVGKTGEDALERIIREGGRRGEIYGKLKALRDRYADAIRARFPRIPRRVSGYNLEQLLPENGFHVARALVGSESTCVTVLEVVTNLIHNPGSRSLLVLGYPDVYAAGDHVPVVMAHQPIGCEGLDDELLGYYKKKGVHLKDLALMPEGGGWLLVEFGADSKQDSDRQARALMADLQKADNPPTMKLYDDPEHEQMIWEVRESSLGATAFVPGQRDTWPGWEDSAVPPERVGDYLRDLKKLFHEHGYDASVYGHFGQGCIHCRIPFDLRSQEGLDNYRRFMDDATDLVIRYGGSLSGEHGDGQARAEYLPKMFGPELMEAMREFKAVWDPDNRMNPGKIVDPYPVTENLRLGTDYDPPQWKTHFKFMDDQGTFSHAVLRCVGVGKCRREQGGTMCPSYMVTREEEHSTRGRARLLFEMLQGDALKHGWKSDAVKDALDLCLACKGCKGDCPVNVDMATYKAEFLSHYFAGRLRPRHAYAFGFINKWARLASAVPQIANFATHAPGLRTLAKWAAGIAPEREAPRFAPETFHQWWARREKNEKDTGGPRVLLWADTFNNHFHPTTAQAAVEVLEAAGFQVEVPRQALCCGRPLYDYGFLDAAERYLRGILDALRPEIRRGTPLVVLEPSCAAVFRDELLNLLPNHEDARRLHDQTFLLSEFLEKKAPDYRPPRLKRKALVHGHCHHKALMGMKDEESLLQKMGLDYRVPESGCCGMAGAFGFETGDHYDVSIACGERVLLPAVRDADDDTLLVADGFSCREQIRQTTGREALHFAQVLQMALREGEEGAPGPRPEKDYLHLGRAAHVRSIARTTGILLAAAGLIGGAAYLWNQRKTQ